MPATNLYQELHDALQTFKTFLDTNVGTIRPAIQALRSMIPQVDTLINGLISLIDRIKTAVQHLDPGQIPVLGQVTSFTDGVKNLLNTAKNLLPDEASAIDEVLGVVNVVSGLPSLTQLKDEILSLLQAITGHLNTLKA